MVDEGQLVEFVQDTGVTPLIFTRIAMGFLMTTESQDFGLTSHPKDKIPMFLAETLYVLFCVSLMQFCFASLYVFYVFVNVTFVQLNFFM